jgi:hypothetical protein
MINPGSEVEDIREKWISSRRLSSSGIQCSINLGRLYLQRKEIMNKVFACHGSKL